MIQIEAVEVNYFRSIYKARLRGLSGMSVLGGPNDVGKSNFLKALNLFFNDETDWGMPFDFSRDFSKERLQQVRRDTVKGKQFVKVTVRLLRGPRYPNSLPARFTVSRIWSRDGSKREITSLDGQSTRALGNLKRYVSTIRYEYVPAIRDDRYFTYLLSEMQDAVLKGHGSDPDLSGLVKTLNVAVGADIEQLIAEFKAATGIDSSIALPSDTAELFRAFEIATSSAEHELPLSMRGDGIRSRFLPSLLHFISERSRQHFIWGFEEPENSLEHGLATRLGQEMAEVYSNDKTQILVTSHSPAFLGLKPTQASLIRVFRDDNGTLAEAIGTTADARSAGLRLLDSDLGLGELQERYQEEVLERLRIHKANEAELERLVQQSTEASAPILLTEGKWDVAILGAAWKALHPTERMEFRILHCGAGLGDSVGGASVLRKHLETARPDLPATIGLFDRDKEGSAQFKSLGRTFSHGSGSLRDVLLGTAGCAGAVLLPPVPHRQANAILPNLEIEHYFSDEVMGMRVDGRGLTLDIPTPQVIMPGFDSVPTIPGIQVPPEYATIESQSKKGFVEKVLPSLDATHFSAFADLFALVQQTIAELLALRIPPKPNGHSTASRTAIPLQAEHLGAKRRVCLAKLHVLFGFRSTRRPFPALVCASTRP